jgi:hypothetical protein
MTKKFTNIEILNIIEALNELIQIKLPTKASWNIMKNIKKFDASIKTFWEAENKLVNEYTIKDEQGNIRFGDDKMPMYAPNNKQKYLKEHQELLNCDDELDMLTIKLSELDNKDIKPATLLQLEFMIEDDTE